MDTGAVRRDPLHHPPHRLTEDGIGGRGGPTNQLRAKNGDLVGSVDGDHHLLQGLNFGDPDQHSPELPSVAAVRRAGDGESLWLLRLHDSDASESRTDGDDLERVLPDKDLLPRPTRKRHTNPQSETTFASVTSCGRIHAKVRSALRPSRPQQRTNSPMERNPSTQKS